MVYPIELAQTILIASIALVAFCGVFLGQIKFSDKLSSISKIPNIDRIRRGLTQSIILGFITIMLIISFFVSGSELILFGTVVFFLGQLGFFMGGAISSGLFRL